MAGTERIEPALPALRSFSEGGSEAEGETFHACYCEERSDVAISKIHQSLIHFSPWQVTGTAAALCAAKNCGTPELRYTYLRKALENNNVYFES